MLSAPLEGAFSLCSRNDAFETSREWRNGLVMHALNDGVNRGSEWLRLRAFRSHLSIMLSEVRHCADCASVRQDDKVDHREKHPLANDVGCACWAWYAIRRSL